MQSPEIDQLPVQEQVTPTEGVQERPDNIELSQSVASTGTKPTDDQFTTQVSGDDGTNLTQPSDGGGLPAITIPKNQQALQSQSKGDTSKGTTWNANFLLRFVKKAVHLGRKVIFGDI